MIFELSNLLVIFIISFVIGVSCFALYFPLVLLWRKGKHIIALTIPLSLSIEILVGYVFYSTELMQWFPIWYGMVVGLLNVYALVRLQQLHLFSWPRRQWDQWWRYGLGVVALAIPILYTRFFDAFVYVAPGNNDTYNHIYFLNDFERVGYLSSPFYAPGFHIILYPLKFFINDADLYRFTGPVLGSFIFLAIYLILRTRWQQWTVKMMWVLFMTFPLFNQLTLQTISFFPSALTFIWFVAFIYLVSRPDGLSRRSIFICYAINACALALTVPYLFVQYLPVLFIFTGILWWQRKHFPAGYVSVLIYFCLITLVALAVGVGHVFLQTRIIRHTIDAFPEIPIVETSGDQIAIRSNYKSANEYDIIEAATDLEPTTPSTVDSNQLVDVVTVPDDSSMDTEQRWWQTFKQKPLVANNVLPIIEVVKELLRVKNIRSGNSLLGLGAYIWILLSVGLFVYGLRSKLPWLSLVALGSLVFGISTQTGILELSYYRGRSGWYLLLLAQLGAASIIDLWYRPKWRKWLYGGLILLYVGSFMSPPVFYRPYYTEPFTVAKQLELNFPNQTVHFITDIWQLVMVSENFTTASLTASSVQNAPETAERFMIMEKESFTVDPVLSQQAYSTDTSFVEFTNRQKVLHDNVETAMTEIKQLPEFSDYVIYWENEHIIIYRYQPKSAL